MYDNARGPKYFLKIKDATHGSFFNGVCASSPTVAECQKANAMARAVNEYSAAFFQKHFLGDAGANTKLQSTDAALKAYLKN